MMIKLIHPCLARSSAKNIQHSRKSTALLLTFQSENLVAGMQEGIEGVLS